MKIGLTEKQYDKVLAHVSENQEIKEPVLNNRVDRVILK
jgi:hypothetical protein